MRAIKINRLTLENFKCHRLLNLVLDGRPVSKQATRFLEKQGLSVA